MLVNDEKTLRFRNYGSVQEGKVSARSIRARQEISLPVTNTKQVQSELCVIDVDSLAEIGFCSQFALQSFHGLL